MADAYHYNAPNADEFTFQCLTVNTVDEPTCLQWLMRVGLIPDTMLCPLCTCAMTLDIANRRWRCGRASKHTSQRDVERSCTSGTSFENSKLRITQIVWILYAWASRMPHKNAEEMSGAAPTSVSDWYSFCRNVCSHELLHCDAKVSRLCCRYV